LDYRDATSLYTNPAKPMRVAVYPHLAEADIKLSKRLLMPSRKSPFKISLRVLEGILRLADVVLLFGSVVIASGLNSFGTAANRNQDILIAIIAAGVTAICLRYGHGYTLQALRSVLTQARVIGISLAAGLTTMLCFFFALKTDQTLESTWALDWLVAAVGMLGLSRILVVWLLRRWDQLGCFTRSLAVVGDPELGYGIIARAAENPEYRVVGLYEDQIKLSGGDIIPSAGQIDDLIARGRQECIDDIVIAVPMNDAERITDLTRKLSVTVSDIYLATDITSVCGSAREIVDVADEPAVLVKQRPLKDWDALQKRAFDVVFASVILLFLAPFMGIIALLIKIDSPGPVLFRQPRFGFNNTLFSVYKFRTMHHDMTDLLADQQTKKNDKRITRVGKWLRKLSLDELPQLQNVILGEMSLVGPRPHAPNTKAGGRRFTEIMAEEYALRHRVRPGITGWAQVNGWRGETQTVEQLEKRVACDLHYIENWSLFFDIKILLLTVRRGIASPQAY
jgi:Undecaprenyl-phosphate glucose phosphotransferase